MAAQQQQFLFNVLDYCRNGKKPPKKRVRYKTPTYLKSYQFRTFNDDTGFYQYYGDEKHIFRIKVLHKIYSAIYNLLVCNEVIGLFDKFDEKNIDGLYIWQDIYTKGVYQYRGQNYQGEEFEYKGACILGTEKLSIKNRVKLHIRLLRYLRKGFSVKEAVLNLKKPTMPDK